MSLKIAIQMDPIERINVAGDSSLALLLEAQARGYEIAYYTPDRMSQLGAEVFAWVQPLRVKDVAGDHASLGDVARRNLRDFDVVLLRQDPPFDLAYVTSTHMLELLGPETLVINDPAAVRDAPEKILVMQFPELMPPTLISRDKREIEAFRARFSATVMKPLYGSGGAAVFKVDAKDMNFGSLFDMFSVTFREAWVIQEYMPQVMQGDKRIILVEGEPLGAVNRVPQQDDIRSNMVRGGRAELSPLTKREREICERIGPELKKRGLLFVGIDVIADRLTEINVTSPTGLRAIKRLGGPDLAGPIWDAIEARAAARR
jgi:glutathione synthase